MSTENVALFIQAINNRADLKDRVAGSNASSESWVKIAFESGYDFTAAELKSAIEETLGREIGTADPVPEYLLAQETMPPGALSQEMLETVTGGIKPKTYAPTTTDSFEP
jgi:hypothetical protein